MQAAARHIPLVQCLPCTSMTFTRAHTNKHTHTSGGLDRVRDLMRGVTQAAPGHEEPNPPPPYPASADPHLPPGWEARTDEVSKKTFYIDHNTKVPPGGLWYSSIAFQRHRLGLMDSSRLV